MSVKMLAGLAALWAMQIIANLLFKWGSYSAQRWIWGFVGGHLFGVTSIVFLMLLYKTMNPNVALGLCLGGAFLLSQIAIAIVFREGISFVQIIGIFAITVGMFLLAYGVPPHPQPTRRPTTPDRQNQISYQ